jgi:hypothetical protein
MALDVASEREANAELELFRRDPARYLTKAQSADKLQREVVRIEVATLARFLAHLSSEGRTKRYRKNLRTYLSQGVEQLAGRDLREVSTQDLKRRTLRPLLPAGEAACLSIGHRSKAREHASTPEQSAFGKTGKDRCEKRTVSCQSCIPPESRPSFEQKERTWLSPVAGGLVLPDLGIIDERAGRKVRLQLGAS